MRKYKSRRRYHRQLNKALFVLYQTVNELDYFAMVSPVSSHDETTRRIEWLKKRLGESIVLISIDAKVPESLLENEAWPV